MNKPLNQFYLAVFLLLLTGCAKKEIFIRMADPPPRSTKILESDSYELASRTPEQCYLSVEELMNGGIDWFPIQSTPLFINSNAMHDILGHAMYMIQMHRSNMYGWKNHEYLPVLLEESSRQKPKNTSSFPAS